MKRTPLKSRTASLPPGCPRGHSYSSLAAAETALKLKGAQGTAYEHLGHAHIWTPAPALGFSAETRLLCRVRAGRGDASQAVCEACGIFLGRYGGEVQHRLARGTGGSRDEVVNCLASAALLCGMAALRTGCHGRAEARDPHMGADAGGWWIRSGNGPGCDPRFVPVLLYGEGPGAGMRVWLHESGPRYLTADPGTGAGL